MDARERFLKAYANVPLGLRTEVVLCLDDEPISWHASYIEIANNTGKSKKILKRLDELAII